jgi:hypothetical protein
VELGMVRSLAFLSAFLGSAEAGDKAKLADLAEHALAIAANLSEQPRLSSSGMLR